ncbi:MAG: glycosyl hydrolase 2 galactose-binding domain-containing protein [Solirubrobacteraceae bacterium]
MPALAGPWELSGDRQEWLPARVPGTVAGALRDAGRPADDIDGSDWWFRTRFARPEGGETFLCLDGVATVSEVWLNDWLLGRGDSMFEARCHDVGTLLADENELVIHCRALAPLLAERRKPRARWRTQVVAEGNLRWFRTAILGRAPSFAPGPPTVGPHRAVRLETAAAVAEHRLRARLDGADGVITVADGFEIEAGGRRAAGELRLPDVERWWPHTHGEPVLHDVRILAGGVAVAERRVGFRAIAPGRAADHDVLADGLDLHVNGVPVFARGATWTPVDPVTMTATRDELRAALETVRDAGMNMLRLPGTGAYEQAAFHDLCDELGILVWQDFMFANLDYPIADEAFAATVEREARQVAAALAPRPSTVVLCGNSEIEQQVAMLGLDPALGRGALFGELLPRVAAEEDADAIYVPSAPSGGTLPFRPVAGIAHYFGVGGYRRPLSDARTAGVRFAAECLAIANAGEGDDALGAPPSDRGTDWDFADVRDHYLGELFGVEDPAALRAADPARYLALSRAVSGEVMAEVFGEWRRAASPCAGGIVLWLRDLVPGPGWGLVDHAGRPKEALAHLRRGLAPLAVWTTDEGMNGIAVHVANDRPEPAAVTLRVSLYRGAEVRVDEAIEEITVGPHDTIARDVEGMLGHFVDASWAYRFGPPQQDVVVASLERDGALLAQDFRFPAGRPLTAESAEELGLQTQLEGGVLTVSARRLVYDLRVAAPGSLASDDAFSVEPGGARRIVLDPAPAAGVTLTALNLAGTVTVA